MDPIDEFPLVLPSGSSVSEFDRQLFRAFISLFGAILIHLMEFRRLKKVTSCNATTILLQASNSRAPKFLIRDEYDEYLCKYILYHA